MKLQWRTFIEWEYDPETKEQKVIRSYTFPLEGYKKKQKPVKSDAQAEQTGIENW